MKLIRHLALLFPAIVFFNFNSLAQCSVTTVPTMQYTCIYLTTIDAFTLNSVATSGNYGCNNTSTGYTFFSTPVRNLTIGSTYNWSASLASYYGYAMGFAIWIDLNSDGQYSSSEMVASSNHQYVINRSGTLTIPAGSVAGTTKMRTRTAYYWNPSAGQACTSNIGYGYGETEDYYVTLCPASISAPTATSPVSACVGTTASLTASASSGTLAWYAASSGGTALGTGSPFTTPTISSTITYYVGAEIPACSMYSSRTAVTVNAVSPPAITAQPANATACIGANTSFGVTATGATTWVWQVNNGSGFTNLSNTPPYSNVGTATMNITGATAVMNGYQYRCIVGNGTCSTTTSSATLTVPPNTAITNNPSDATACVGTNASFSVTAVGANRTYQWQVDQGSGFNNLSNGAPYSNVTTATMNITNATAGMNGYLYRCVVNSDCPPSTPVNSTAATLTVVSPPTITTQPINDTTCVGENASFSVTASGTSLNYQWQVNIGFGFFDLNNTGVYSNVTTAMMNITGATANMNNYQYRCRVSRPGCASVNSSSALLVVRTLPNITGQPTSRVLCAGANTTMSVTATGSLLTYQWQVDMGAGVVNVTNGGVYSGATTNTLTMTGVTAGMNGYIYRCIVSGYCTPPDTSSNATLTVNVPPTITSQPRDSVICANDNATFTITATGSGINYSWEVDNGSGWTACGAAPPYSGATTPTLTVTGAPASMNGYKYRCQVAGVCSPLAYSNEVMLTVNSFPVITGTFFKDTICELTNTVFAVTATGAGLTYQWQESGGGPFLDIMNTGIYSGATTDTLKLTKPTTAVSGKKYRCIVTNACPPAATSSEMSMFVILDKHVTSQPSDVYVLPGSNTRFIVSETGTKTSVVWQVDDGKGFVSLDRNGPMYYGYTTDTLLVKGVTQAIDGYRYRALVYGGCMPGPIASYGAKLIVGNTSVRNVNGKSAIYIYPNPANSVLFVEAAEGSRAIISTIEGKMMLQENITKEGINIKSLANGVYMIKVLDKDGNMLGVNRFTKTSN